MEAPVSASAAVVVVLVVGVALAAVALSQTAVQQLDLWGQVRALAGVSWCMHCCTAAPRWGWPFAIFHWKPEPRAAT